MAIERGEPMGRQQPKLVGRQQLNANGARRRAIRARVLAEETHCAICGQWVDKGLKTPDPMSPEVDEDVPRVRGGSQYDRANTHLTHRRCNQAKGKRTLAEHAARQQPVEVTTTTLVQW